MPVWRNLWGFDLNWQKTPARLTRALKYHLYAPPGVLTCCSALLRLSFPTSFSEVPGVLRFDAARPEDGVWRGHQSGPVPPTHQGEEEEVQNILRDHRGRKENTVAVRTRRLGGKETMAGFPKYLFTPCVLACVEAPVVHTSIWKPRPRLKRCRRFLFTCICLVLSVWREWGDFVTALGNGRVGANFMGSGVDFKGGFYKTKSIMSLFYEETLLVWNIMKIIADLAPALHSFPIHTKRFLLPWWNFTLRKNVLFRSFVVAFFSFFVHRHASSGLETILFTCVIRPDWGVSQIQSTVITLSSLHEY